VDLAFPAFLQRCLSRRTNIPLTLIDLDDRGFERYRLWVLKNSFPRNPQKIKSRQDPLQTTSQFS
jgi:hypothetical protein